MTGGDVDPPSRVRPRPGAAIHATVRLVINPAPVLKAPATIRSLAAPATTRLLKAISHRSQPQGTLKIAGSFPLAAAGF
jgi:hypothetical protein